MLCIVSVYVHVYCGHVFVSVVLLVSVHACNSVDDIIFMGLTVMQVAGEDFGSNIPSRVRCPERPLLELPNGYHSLHPYGFSGSFRVVSPTQPSVGLSNKLRFYIFRF